MMDVDEETNVSSGSSLNNGNGNFVENTKSTQISSSSTPTSTPIQQHQMIQNNFNSNDTDNIGLNGFKNNNNVKHSEKSNLAEHFRVFVEIGLTRQSTSHFSEVKKTVWQWLVEQKNNVSLVAGECQTIDFRPILKTTEQQSLLSKLNDFLEKNVRKIQITLESNEIISSTTNENNNNEIIHMTNTSNSGNETLSKQQPQPQPPQSKSNHYSLQTLHFTGETPPEQFQLFVFQLNEEESATDTLEGNDNAACQQWILPSTEFDGLWDSLIFEDGIKSSLLDYVTTTLLFSEKQVDSKLISWNRVILLNGPPGTGKTSLCKALAQKLSIRLSDRFRNSSLLVEINSHSLFSKWFSESGKLVMKMFDRIRELIEEGSLVCVLIDEVESLTAARKSSSQEPSDAIRVVNAVLTQLDSIRNHNNVLIMATSNITGAIDMAFIDRADIKQFIGLPTAEARYQIIGSCIRELMRVGIISNNISLLDYRALPLFDGMDSESTKFSRSLSSIVEHCDGFSGRSLRKLAFLAHARFIQRPVCTIDQFMFALRSAVIHEKQAVAKLK